MPLYSPLFKRRTRKTAPATEDHLNTARLRSIMEDLALRINNSPLESSTKEKLEEELEGVIRDRHSNLYYQSDFWRKLIDAVNEANIRDHVKR